MTKINRLILSLFGIGNLPFAQGTFASIAGLVLAFLVKDNYLYASLLLIFILSGFILINKEPTLKDQDPPWIVIDEVCGMLVTYLFLPRSAAILLLGFVFFRFFDISKIYPIKKIENLKGSLGIMLDDIASGIISNIMLQVVLKFASSILL